MTASVGVSDSQTVSYGVTADNTALKGAAGDESGGEQFPALDRYIE
jgi:hypothetical protein